MSKALTVKEVLDLPAAVNIGTAGRAWGFGLSKSQDLARKGEFPCPVQRIGYTYRVLRSDILDALGIQDPALVGHRQPVDIPA
ncbi:DNA-binding protein [Nonomuraea bangladeshensis]|uniref:DNA-binding protein n=1 Tax=Nonomuraea bangladeshensis TaxID=404385 RepID=UPI0031DADBAC